MEVGPLKEKILKHYNSVSREQSPKEVVQLRKISNYAKSTLFSTFAKPVSDHPSILDMSCGRGGDIGKWEKQGFEVTSHVRLPPADWARPFSWGHMVAIQRLGHEYAGMFVYWLRGWI